MKLLFVIFGIFLIGCSISKKALINKVEKNSLKMDAPDSVLLSFQKNSDLVIGYGTNSAWNLGTFYCLFVLKGRQWQAIKYVKKSAARIGEKFYSVDSFEVPGNYIDSLLLNISKNKSIFPGSTCRAINGLLRVSRSNPNLIIERPGGCPEADREFHICVYFKFSKGRILFVFALCKDSSLQLISN